MFFSTLKAFTQEKEQNTTNVSKATIIEPGFAHEFPAGRNQTFFARAGITATFDNNDPYGGSSLGKILFRGFVSGSFRVYYNFEKRKLKEKNTDRNSANYFALLTIVATKPFNKPKYDMRLDNPILNAGIVWGLQRNFPSRFSLDLNIGLGYGKVGSETGIIPIGEFNIGFWLGEKKNE